MHTCILRSQMNEFEVPEGICLANAHFEQKCHAYLQFDSK